MRCRMLNFAIRSYALLCLTFGLSSADGSHSDWSYDNQDDWKCDATNMRQSPIDIVTADVITKADWNLSFINYDQDVDFEVKNTHHSVCLTPIDVEDMPTIKVNWVDGDNEFELHEIHFHWGDATHKGSEHEINHQRAAAEMHMVHYKKGITSDEVGSVENSVVVIGVFIESDSFEHNKLESLVSSAANVNGTDEICRANKPEHLINLLPDELGSFYTYNGSLTTPPCYEVVTWVIMSQPVIMSEISLQKMRELAATSKDSGVKQIGPNFRDIQPLLDRPVYSSYDLSSAVIGNSTFRDSAGRFSIKLKKYIPEIRVLRSLVRDAKRAMSATGKLLRRAVNM